MRALLVVMAGAAAAHCPPVIGTGLPKTGTRSLAHYMQQALGYETYKFAGGLDFERDFIPLVVDGRRSDSVVLKNKTFYDDYPWYAAPCAFAKTTTARFVHMERNCSAWAASAIHQLFCRWLRGGCVSGGFNASTTRFGYQVTYYHFERLASGLIDDACRSQRDVCGGDARLVPRFVAACEAHSRLVRECVPPSRLFAARLDATFNRTGLDALGPFLGCQYRMPLDESWGVFGQRGVT